MTTRSRIFLAAGVSLVAVSRRIFSGAESLPPEQESLPDQDQPAKNRTIFALGDSLTAGYQLPIEESYPSQLEGVLQNKGYDYTVSNGGKSGDTSAGLLARLEWSIEEATSGDLAIVVIGANDGMRSLSLEELENNIGQMVQLLQNKGVRVILGGMQIPTNLDPLYRERFTTLYPSLAEEYAIPLIPFFLENVATQPDLNLSDGIHPNQQGYTIIATQTAEFLIKNGLVEK